MNQATPGYLVLDASVAIKWHVPEDLAGEARRFMTSRFAIHVPTFFAAECGNTIWKKVAQGREFDRAAGRQILDDLLAYPMQVHDSGALTALAYDMAHEVGNAKLAIYDFAYLSLALALDRKLVTADGPFHKAIMATPFADRMLWVADPI